MNKISVILLEDEPAHAEAIRRVLSDEQKYSFRVIDSVKEYYDYVAVETPDIVIADINVKDGKSTRILVSPPEKIKYPILILTSYGDEKTAVDAMKAGALDYLVKSPEIFADMPHMIERSLRQWELIIERKRNEEELNKYRTELELLVKSRTEQLDNANLRLQDELNKQKEYELILQSTLEKERELNELKSRFISTTSHEFRTPLTTILTSTDLMDRYGEKWPDEKKEVHINRIREAVRYLTKLLDDIITISRADSGKLLCEPKTIDLDSFCKDVISEVKVHEKENHNLEYFYNLEPGNYLLDKKLVKFMLSNLLSNAYKYSPNGGTIRLKVYGTESKIIFSVQDNGIGISESEQIHLFEPFYRSSNAVDIPGTGLGLSIVKKAVQIHGGEIDFSSINGKGTTFKIELPKLVVD